LEKEEKPPCMVDDHLPPYAQLHNVEYFKELHEKDMQKKNLRQHSVLDWSPTSILSGPCDACLRGSDETRKVHRGMAADEDISYTGEYVLLSQT
jgi:hypothetical protein